MHACDIHDPTQYFKNTMNFFLTFFKANIRLPKSPVACVSDGEIGIINAMT